MRIKDLMIRQIAPLLTGRSRGVSLLFFFCPLLSLAQYNIDRVLTAGRAALYYEDYVLSIQYFNQVITAKPYLYEPWFFRGVAKFYLDDWMGAENDCSEAIRLNPYISGQYELRGLCRLRQKKYKEAMDCFKVKRDRRDYSKAFKYYRKEWIEKNIGWMVGLLIAIIVLSIVVKIVKKIKWELNTL
jgi:tetratricopeptide (TPR) repeat protein